MFATWKVWRGVGYPGAFFFPAKEGGHYSVLAFCKVKVESWELGIGSFS